LRKDTNVLYKFDGKQPVIGKETYVSETATVIGDVVIGDNCYIGHGAIVRGDYGRIEIGDGTAVEEGVIIHCPPNEVHVIGKSVTIGHGAMVHGKLIDDHAVIGLGASVSIWSEVGEWAIVAEGAVVRMKQVIPPGTVAAGNPARAVRKVSAEDRKLWNLGKLVYVDLAKKYLKEGMLPVE
jgi:carbonic anhydrase/acetyltransferase-like protein (isoleucine patch superfamily)